jgi:uncharacterized protein (DUF2062 family)
MKRKKRHGGVPSGSKRNDRPSSGPSGPWARLADFLKLRILHVDDSPERIARGVAVAFWVTFAIAPLLGLHIWIALILAFVFRANKISMLAFMWVHNPVTMWPILYLNARVGGLIAGIWSQETGAGLEKVADFLRQWQEQGVIASIMHGDFWKRLLHVMLNVGTEVWIGGAILGAVAAAASYFGTKHAVIWYRKTKAYLRRKKQMEKAAM